MQGSNYVRLTRHAGPSATAVNRGTEVRALVDSTDGRGYCHDYDIVLPETATQEETLLARLRFQQGSPEEVGVNGMTLEQGIAVAIDRLERFQDSPTRCRQNALAITKLEEALFWLNDRTAERLHRGVEGTDRP